MYYINYSSATYAHHNSDLLIPQSQSYYAMTVMTALILILLGGICNSSILIRSDVYYYILRLV